MGIVLTFDERVFKDNFLKASAQKLDEVLRTVGPRVAASVGTLSEELILASPEAESLINPHGMLRGELGVIAAAPAVHAVAKAVSGGMFYSHNRCRVVGQEVRGGFTISLLRIDLKELEGVMDAASFRSHQYDIDWLRWLTVGGDGVIIADYQFQAGPSPASRTNLGVMRKGGIWQVPGEFSGTYQDNWLTRALVGLEGPVERLVTQEMEGALG